MTVMTRLPTEGGGVEGEGGVGEGGVEGEGVVVDYRTAHASPIELYIKAKSQSVDLRPPPPSTK